MTVTAILLATAPAAGGGPTALLPFDDGTLLRHLVDQLGSVGVRRVEVVTRPGWQAGCAAALAGGEPDGQRVRVEVQTSRTTAEDLATVAEIVEHARGALLVGLADIAAHRGALAGLLLDPRISTGVLSTGARTPWTSRIRSSRGRVVSAGSAYHSVRRPTGCFLGLLKVAPQDRDELIRAAHKLAALAADPPESWLLERDRKRVRRRLAAYRALHEPDHDTADPPPEAVELDPDTEAHLDLQLRISQEDVVSLLLVGLVRHGVQVTNSYLRSLLWTRPESEAAAEHAAARIAAINEDRVLLDSAVKGSDGFFTTFFVSPYSKYIARWAARRGWTPNAVTTISLGIGLVAAAAFATGGRAGLVAGAVLLQLAFTMDCVDGQLARYTRTFSKLGAWLDSVFDRVKEYAVYAGLAWGAGRGLGDEVWALAGAALALQTVRHSIDFSFAARQHQLIATRKHVPLEIASDKGTPPVRSASDAPHGGTVVAGGLGTAPRAAAVTAPTVLALDADLPEPMSEHAGSGLLRRASRAALRVSRWLDRPRWTRWAKKMISFPIGERFALISVTAAIWEPRVAFLALLVWGSVAALYGTTGKLLRSVT